MEFILNIPPKQLADGIRGHYVHGESMTFGYVEIEKGSIVPMHQHVQEQITYIVEGQLDMNIGGKDYSLTAGMCHVIASNVPHNAIAVTPVKVIDVFNPVREDYRKS